MTATAEPSAAVPPPRPPRPGTVTVAFWLQLGTVLILLGLVTLLVLAAVDWNDAIDKALRQVPDADPDEVRAERWNTVMMATVFGVPALLLALWLGLTSGWVLRGSNTARVMVFVAGGLQLLLCVAQGCAGSFLIPFGLAFALADGPYVDEPYPEDVPPPDDEFWPESDFIEALYDQPNAFEVFLPLTGLGVLLVFLLTAAVVLLLALPPAHRWFVPRSEPATTWPPPGGDIPNAYLVNYPVPTGYPAPPGYPPGYPPPPGYGVPGAGYAGPWYPGYAEGGPAPRGNAPYPAASLPVPETPPVPAAPPASDGSTSPGGVTAASGGDERGGAVADGTDRAER
ncbi:hypothetical protein [Micromonospora sp. C95]|uniref:hypothetical protein n=1 Tax=Micromonospora sp. C95 TaxID=2824882 RepID=UPI001B378E33|nr:hypothetical protein [Micromonospora sp. C95]MBQ1023211.1 hypothetical protein [Micromonospora sp. C95]